MIAETAPSLGTDYYLMDDLLTDEERAVRDKVRAFCDREVIPIAQDYWDRAEFPFELVPKLARLASSAAPSRATAAPDSAPSPSG